MTTRYTAPNHLKKKHKLHLPSACETAEDLAAGGCCQAIPRVALRAFAATQSSQHQANVLQTLVGNANIQRHHFGCVVEVRSIDHYLFAPLLHDTSCLMARKHSVDIKSKPIGPAVNMAYSAETACRWRWNIPKSHFVFLKSEEQPLAEPVSQEKGLQITPSR